MLPKLVRLQPAVSPRNGLALALCATVLLGLPTFYGVAQSQEVDPLSNSTQSSANEKQETRPPQAPQVDKVEAQAKPEQKKREEAQGSVTKEQRTPSQIEKEFAPWVVLFNELLKEKRYAQAELIAKTAHELYPQNSTAELMAWKVNFASRNDNHQHKTADAIGTSKVSKIRAPSVEYLPRPTTEEERIVLALAAKTSFDFEDVPLPDAMKEIAQQHKINIVFDLAAYKPDSPLKEMRISLRVREVSLKNSLNLILQCYQLTYVVADEVLKITPVATAESQAITRIYPVQDLVGDSNDFESLITAIQLSVARGSWSTIEGISVGNVARPTRSTNSNSNGQQYIGGISKVPTSGSIVVHHNRLVQSEVLELLRGLREAKAVPAKQ